MPAPGLIERVRSLAGETLAAPGAWRADLGRGWPALESTIAATYRRLASASEEELGPSRAAEWLLDNHHVVMRALRGVETDLEPAFQRRLPRLCRPGGARPVRVGLLAASILEAGELDLAEATGLLRRFQERAALTMAELWALPLFLRLVLLERLAAAVAGLGAAEAPVEGSVRLATDEEVGACVRGLRLLDATDWRDVFEGSSRTEAILRRDPAGVHARSDFATRDRCRKAVEEMALGSGRSEEEVARAALQAASAAAGGRARHVGHHLLGEGRDELEGLLGHRPPPAERLRRGLRRRPEAWYFGAVLGLTAALLAGALAWCGRQGAPAWLLVLGLVLLLVPAVTVAVGVVHALVTRVLPPRVLPKLAARDGIPADFATVVAVPVLLADEAELRDILAHLEVRYLANPDENLEFALLSDFADASEPELPEDERLLEQAVAGVRSLNERHGGAGRRPFHLLHRPRLWNEAEGCFMAWERKRGKLAQFDAFLGGAEGDAFQVRVGDADRLRATRFVLTLDADTELPRGAAARLVATLAHPLNRPERDPAGGRVLRGYTVLQPRIEVTAGGAGATPFALAFAAGMGFDPYSRAVSDAYQDLFGEGSFVGKGLYDREAFERDLEGRVPENAILSHDLFEGCHGRVGLATDILLIESQPEHYLAHSRRVHRWVRGDWQLLPWLGRRVPRADGARDRSRFSLLSRWKLLDNLRRSLLPIALLASLATAWLVGRHALGLTLLLLAVPAVPGLLHESGRLLHWSGAVVGRRSLVPLLAELRGSALRWLLEVAFLPHQAQVAADAILRTLWRLAVSRRRLLEWTSASLTGRRYARGGLNLVFWREMAVAPAVALALGAALAAWSPAALPAAAPLLLLWLASPALAQRLSRRTSPRTIEDELSGPARTRLRRLARRTWHYFETFTRPEDQWLPPDHYQEQPRGAVAHRTSPTNVGLGLTAVVAAHDLGYVGPLGALLRLRNAFDSMGRMERHRGHFLNWYETTELTPLAPRYVSTVDSGNLAGCLLVVRHWARSLGGTAALRDCRWDGLLDSLGVLRAVAEDAAGNLEAGALEPFLEALRGLNGRVMARRGRAAELLAALDDFVRAEAEELDRALAAVLDARGDQLGDVTASALRRWMHALVQDVAALDRTAAQLLPWARPLAAVPDALARGGAPAEALEAWRQLQREVALEATLEQLAFGSAGASAAAARLVEALEGAPSRHDGPGSPTAWAASLLEGLELSSANARELLEAARELADRAEVLVRDMDFSFLHDEQRGLLRIGFDLSAQVPSEHHYDLLASEARLASLLAIGKGDVPEEHWLQLGRPIGRVSGRTTLLSWSGSMFEYLMPPLFLFEEEGSLLGHAARAAVRAQVQHGRRHGLPWGVSESAYNLLDAHRNYQYRAFGVPELGFKRGLEDDLVVAPYASVLALRVAPREVVANLARLESLGALGAHGFYEALDFTPSRLTAGRGHAVVRSYMAHHQGMILAALDNALCRNALVARLHAEPFVQTARHLLRETPPVRPSLEAPAVRREAAPAPARSLPSVEPWLAPRQELRPSWHVLSNGRQSLRITGRGEGVSWWRRTRLTGGEPDPVLGGGGFRTWVAAEGSARFRSVEGPPAEGAGELLAWFSPQAVELHRRLGLVSVIERIALAMEDDVELRRLRLSNESDEDARLRLVVAAPVVLGEAREHARHPAFSRLFVECRWLPDVAALAAVRRGRRSEDEAACLVQSLVLPATGVRRAGHDGSRETFVGRSAGDEPPLALSRDRGRLAGTTGTVLDPILAQAVLVDLPARGSVDLAVVQALAPTVAAAAAALRRHRTLAAVERAFQHAGEAAPGLLARFGLDRADLQAGGELLSLLWAPAPELLGGPEGGAVAGLGQASLWRHGISGDRPILAVQVRDDEEFGLLAELLRHQAWWRHQGIELDLVLLSRGSSGYGSRLDERLQRLLAREGRPEGVHVLHADQLPDAERDLLLTSAAVVLDPAAGSLRRQLEGLEPEPPRLPALEPEGAADPDCVPVPRPEGLLFDNGLGGFSPDGREHVLHLEPGRRTPAPWANVVAWPSFGFVATESGGGFTWSENSAQNRLTPWSNDPLADPPGEVVYLRDEQTGRTWSATAQPAPGPGPYQVRHGAGSTSHRNGAHGLLQELRLYAAPEDPVKIFELRLEERSGRDRRLTVTLFVEWALGGSRDRAPLRVVPEYVAEPEALLASSDWDESFAGRVAFAAASRRLHGLTADRHEFFGRDGSRRRPAALARIGLSNTVRPGLDPCAALQVHVDLPAGSSEVLHFVLGQGADRTQALRLVERYRERPAIEAAWTGSARRWSQVLDAVSVRTPDPALDLMLSGWMLYQTLSCRIWGRTGFYQSSGAFGFRDQLQDVLALLHAKPDECRRHLLEAARHQFEEGDVLHWWHPPGGAGVRTRCSDDLLWLPHAAAAYVAATGDTAVLQEELPFLSAPPLAPGERERHGRFEPTGARATLHEHCLRALRRGSTRGERGLPLMGTGDWNDGMNRVGERGRGESVWLAWFLHATSTDYAHCCEALGEGAVAAELRERAEGYRAAAEEHGWDGAWYRRAFDDDGGVLGSAGSASCRIDSIAQSWAVISGAAHEERARLAVESAWEQLARPDEGLLLLLAPPFDSSAEGDPSVDPGYIADYPPGVRENGGQYTHAAAWLLWALAELGDGDRAGDMLSRLLPVRHAATPEQAERYRVEPHAVAADVYAVAPHVGRGGWTWYTGSAAWLYRLALERVLGIRLVGGELLVEPCIPSSWPRFEVTLRQGETSYTVRVENPDGACRGVAALSVDGEAREPGPVRRLQDGRAHEIVVRLGPPALAPA